MPEAKSACQGGRPSPGGSTRGPPMIVPSAPDGWVPSMVADPDGPLRMLASSDCTRAPIAKLPGAGAAVTVMLAVPLLPPLEAGMVGDPAAPPFTGPLAPTRAVDAGVEEQVQLCP